MTLTRRPFGRWLQGGLVLGLCVASLLGAGAARRPNPPSAYGAVPPGRFSFRRYGSEQGLRNLAVLSMLQDHQGFMWMGSEDGLYRYDGHRFQSFGTRDGLPSSYIIDMVEDGPRRLWVGTYQGLALREGDRFRTFGKEEGLPEGPILDLSAGKEEGLWAATNAGPFVFAAGHFQALHNWPGGAASAVCYRGSSQGWVALWSPAGPSKGSRILEYQGGTWKAWDEPSAFGHERLDAILQDGQGRVWARSSGHLWVLEPGGAQFREARPGLPPINARAILRAGRGGSVLVPTDRGIYTFSQGAWSVMDERMGLPTSYVRDVVEDHEGSLWFSSLGVYRLLGRGLWRAYTHSDGLPDDVVWTILRDRSRNLLVGTDRGLAVASAQGWQPYRGTEGNVIRSAVEAPDGTLYMGGSPVEVLRWNPRTRQVDGRFGAESGLVGKRIFRLVLDDQGMLWAATDGGGLLRADTKAKTLRFESQILPGGSATEYVSGLWLGASHRLYASGEYGFAVQENGTWRRYTQADGLERTHVAYCIETRDGDIVLAYFESLGFTRLHIEGGHLRILGSPDPNSELGREKLYMMGEDSKGRLWVGTGRGVYAVKDAEVQHFGLAEGLVGEDVDNMAFFSDPGGDVWVGTSAGLARFDAAAYKGALRPPPTVLLGATLGGHPQPFEGGIRVPHSQNTLEARFAGLSYLGEGFIQHQVRLAGLEEEWHLSDIDEVRYPALAGGDYTLEVRSRIAQGEWGETVRFPFSVLPAWWQTWWFRLLLLAAAAGAVTAVIRWRLASLRRYSQELEALVHQRTAELEAANEALRNQSLTDPLTGLRNRRYLGVRMSEDVAQVQRTLRQMQEKREGRAEVSVDLVFAMVDLDHFKEVNDTYGHAAGDCVLQQTAEILQQATRESDTVVRWGGEEFLVVARNAARKDATALVERIRATVEAHAFEIEDGRQLRRTCSVGFSFFPFFHPNPEILTWEQVVDMADHCLYAAKRSGRNGWVGISATPSLRLEELNSRPAQHIPELLAEGAVEIQSSFPEGTPLHWDKES